MCHVVSSFCAAVFTAGTPAGVATGSTGLSDEEIFASHDGLKGGIGHNLVSYPLWTWVCLKMLG